MFSSRVNPIPLFKRLTSIVQRRVFPRFVRDSELIRLKFALLTHGSNRALDIRLSQEDNHLRA
jgi:hypothetical protein